MSFVRNRGVSLGKLGVLGVLGSSSLLALVRRSGDLETLLSVSRTTRLARGVVRFSDYSSRQGSRTSPHKSRQGSDSPPRMRRSGDSPQRFSDYSSRQGTLLRVSRTTRLARGLSSEFLRLLVSPGDSPQSFSAYSSRQGSRTPPRKSRQGSDTPPLMRLRL